MQQWVINEASYVPSGSARDLYGNIVYVEYPVMKWQTFIIKRVWEYGISGHDCILGDENMGDRHDVMPHAYAYAM